MGQMKTKFQELIESLAEESDFSQEPERIFELLAFLDKSEGTTYTAAKIFILRYGHIVDNDFLIKLLSIADKEALSEDDEVLNYFKNNEEILLFLKL